MGVYCTDRLTGSVLGLPRRVWLLLADTLVALSAPRAELAARTDGYVPSWLARSWGEVLFSSLGDVVVVARPVPGRTELRPVAVYRRGSPAGLTWSRAGEQLSVYDLPLAGVLLHVAQFCSAGTGHTVTTLRPPAPGTPLSAVAGRTLQVRSGLYPARTARRPPEKRTA